MAILKSVQVLSESSTSWEDAVQQGVKRASKTIKNIRSANINNKSCSIKDGQVSSWRVNMQITFEIE